MSSEAPRDARVEVRAAGGPVLRLLLDPGRFFPEGARNLSDPAIVALVALLGASSVIDRLETGALRTGLAGRAVEVADSWEQYWGVALAGLFVAGPIAYWFNGWWCSVRLRFSGVADPDSQLARRLSLLSSTIVAVATVSLTALDTWRYPNPNAAWGGVEPFAWTLFVAPLWSVYVNYRGVCASFPVDRARARLWFAVLPVVFFVLLLGGGAVAALDLIG